MSRVLLVDDDVELCEMLRTYLVNEGFEVDAVHDGDAGLERGSSGRYDLIVLDVMMPGRGGFDVLRGLRPKVSTPVLMLTARGEDVDSIVGLELGADDYLAKPCNLRVLTARARAILRRAGGAGRDPEASPEVLELDDLAIHLGSRTVTRGERAVDTTSTEFSVLEALARDAGQVVTKAELSERALGRKLSRHDRSLDMHVSNLRRKLGPTHGGEERIKTVRGVGYLFVR